MCYHSSRFKARQATGDSVVLYAQQDKSLWDNELIYRGNHYLINSARGDEFSSYHLESRIAYWHCQPEDSKEKWEKILLLYDQLLQINYSPSVALNRCFALYKVFGAKAALEQAEKLEMENNHFYFTLLGELYKGVDAAKARQFFEQAHHLAKTQSDKQVLLSKIKEL